MNIPLAAFNAAVQIANDQGLLGKRVNLVWVPPQTASQSEMGVFIVREKPHRSAADP